MGCGRQRHVRQDYLWGWERSAHAPWPQDLGPDWPRGVPPGDRKPPRVERSAEASQEAPPCGTETHTWASSRVISAGRAKLIPTNQISPQQMRPRHLKAQAACLGRSRPSGQGRCRAAARGQRPASGRFPRPAPFCCGNAKAWQGPAREAEEAGLHRNLHLFPARLCEIRGCCGGQSQPARFFPAAPAGEVGVVHNHHGGGRSPGW